MNSAARPATVLVCGHLCVYFELSLPALLVAGQQVVSLIPCRLRSARVLLVSALGVTVGFQPPLPGMCATQTDCTTTRHGACFTPLPPLSK